MDAQYVWTCPKCGRGVPRRVSSCRCGYQQPASGVAAEQPTTVVPAEPPPDPITVTRADSPRTFGSPIAVITSVALAILATAGVSAWWWTGRPHANDARAGNNPAAVSPSRAAAPR